MTLQDAKEVIRFIRMESKPLGSWDQAFLRSIATQTYPLTKKQEGVLLALYAKITGGGTYQRKDF